MRRLILSLAAVYRKLFLLFLRLKGQTPASRAEERVAAGKTWEDFCDTLKAAGVNVLRHAEVDMRTKAEGYRYLSRLTRAGLENFVEFSDPRFPELRRMVHETVKMGADNPDNHYFNAVVSGEYKYRIKGTRGTVKFLTFSTQKGGYGKGGGLPPSGFLDSNNLIVDDMGRFEIIASVTPESGNWLPMEPDTGLLMVRQTFFDRAREEPAVFTIECLVEGCTPAPLDALAHSRGRKPGNPRQIPSASTPAAVAAAKASAASAATCLPGEGTRRPRATVPPYSMSKVTPVASCAVTV